MELLPGGRHVDHAAGQRLALHEGRRVRHGRERGVPAARQKCSYKCNTTCMLPALYPGGLLHGGRGYDHPHAPVAVPGHGAAPGVHQEAHQETSLYSIVSIIYTMQFYLFSPCWRAPPLVTGARSLPSRVPCDHPSASPCPGAGQRGHCPSPSPCPCSWTWSTW